MPRLLIYGAILAAGIILLQILALQFFQRADSFRGLENFGFALLLVFGIIWSFSRSLTTFVRIWVRYYLYGFALLVALLVLEAEIRIYAPALGALWFLASLLIARYRWHEIKLNKA